MTRTIPLRWITLHLSHIFFTDGLTFISVTCLLIAICYPPASKIVGRELNENLVTWQYTDEILPHLPGYMSQNLVAILVNRNLEHCIRQRFQHCRGDLYRFLFRHTNNVNRLNS